MSMPPGDAMAIGDDGAAIAEMVAASAEGVFRELSPIEDAARRESVESGDFDAQGWSSVREAGFLDAMLPEEQGGIGIEHAMTIANLAGLWAVPLPVVETMGANWLLSRAGAPSSGEPIGLSAELLALHPAEDGWRVDGKIRAVPWARHGSFLAAGQSGEDSFLVLLQPGDFTVLPGVNLANEPRDACTISATIPRDRAFPITDDPVAAIRSVGAVLRSAQMAGAIARILAMTVNYVRERRQFGKPLAAFQAVQQLLAVIATQAAAAEVAAAVGARGLDGGEDLTAAVAKIRAGEAAGIVAAAAHQLHGAIGFTQEYPLHLASRRLWSWRDEFGSESEWAIVLGRALAPEGRDLWQAITRI